MVSELLYRPSGIRSGVKFADVGIICPLNLPDQISDHSHFTCAARSGITGAPAFEGVPAG